MRRRNVAELEKKRGRREADRHGFTISHTLYTRTCLPVCKDGYVCVCVCVCAFVSEKIKINNQNLIIALIFNLVAIQKGAVSRLEIHQIRLHLEYDPTHSVVLYMCSVYVCVDTYEASHI